MKLAPYYVIENLNYPAVAGLYIASLFSAALRFASSR